jgi:hypothetical protein
LVEVSQESSFDRHYLNAEALSVEIRSPTGARVIGAKKQLAAHEHQRRHELEALLRSK